MARTVTGIDIGTRTTKFLRGSYKGNTFHVTGFAVTQHAAAGVADAWSASAPGFKPTEARIGLTGRDVNIRYTRVPRVPDWQLRKLMRFEVDEIGEASGAEVSSDFNVLPPLPEIEGEDVVLLCMARERLLEEHSTGIAGLSGSLDAFSPNALALYNAWLRYGVIEDQTILIANIGHENLDVILVRGPDLLFARNLSGGSKLFDDSIAERFNVKGPKAERIKIEYATLEPGAKPESPNHEKASRACLGAAGQLLSLLQSTVMFCKSQVKLSSLRVDRVLLCGGGSAMSGLCPYLSTAMSMPVELFDPFVVIDTSGLQPESADLLEEYKLESVVALGLATMASDPEAYSVELLPAKVRKRREFVGSTLFMIAAAVLGVAYLGFHGVKTRAELAQKTQSVQAQERKLDKAKDTDRNTRDLVAENELLAERAMLLQGVAGSGEQLARSLVAVHDVLPDGFWVTNLTSEWRFEPDLGIERGSERPILRVEGRAREGTDSISVLYEGFLARLKDQLPEAQLNPNLSPSGDKFTLDLTSFGPPQVSAEPGEDEDESARAGEQDGRRG